MFATLFILLSTSVLIAAPDDDGKSLFNGTSDEFVLNSITGFVFGPGRQPLNDVHVELANDLGSPIGRTKTGGSGIFYFRGLPNGIYIVKILPYGINYIPEEKRVSLISLSAIPGSGSVKMNRSILSKAPTSATGTAGRSAGRRSCSGGAKKRRSFISGGHKISN